MHPEDVAEYVSGQVALLRARLAERDDLNVTAVELGNDMKLFISFDKLDRPRLSAVAPAHLADPRGAAIGIQFTGVDLSAATSRRPLVLAMDCSDFDGEPPTAELLLPDRLPLPFNDWPKDLPQGGVISGHKIFKRPFFCRRGLREFHTHPQHEDEPWDRYRESITLPDIAIELLDDLRYRWILSS